MAKAKEKTAKRNALLEKLREHTTIVDTDILSESKLFNEKDVISLLVPALNIAFSGDIEGGFVPGLTTWAGISKHFKTGFMLVCAKAYMDKYPDAILLFYDSEFGSPKSYFDVFGIDKDRVIHSPLLNLEQLKFDIVKQLDHIERGDHLFIAVDSVGNLASKKEIEDAMAEKSTADMTRAKQIKSLFRMVTPHLVLKDIHMHVVNHTYKTMEMFSKDVVSGGTGPYYSSDNIFIIGRQQEKDKNNIITGYDFIINVEKSRYVREKSKIPISVDYAKGMSKWSGLLDIAVETGHVQKGGTKGTFQTVNEETGELGDELTRLETDNKAFWEPLLTSTSFKQAVKDRYQLSANEIVQQEPVEDDTDEA
jgi:RecA/RadA recombinase